MSRRTDVHRPSAINPEEYDYVATLGDNEFGLARSEMDIFNAHRLRTGGYMAPRYNSGDCHVCGARCIYRVVWYHLPTNTYITTGYDCADKIGTADPTIFKRLKDEAARARRAKAGKEKAMFLLAENNLTEAWDIATSNECEKNKYGVQVRDMVTVLIRFGDLTEKQWEYLPKAIEAFNTYDQKRQEEAENAEPIPNPGTRMTIKGEVLCVKQVESMYGYVSKILVRADEGWKVWGTVPTSIKGECERGAFIQFDAKVEVKEEDPKFGFFSRPTRGKVIAAAPAA